MAPLQAREQHAYLRDLGQNPPYIGLRPITLLRGMCKSYYKLLGEAGTFGQRPI